MSAIGRLLVAALAIGAVTAAFAGSSGARTGAPCGGGRTVVSSPGARVYASRGRVYACLTGARASRLLGLAACRARPHAGRVEHERLAGRFVAYGRATCGVDASQETVRVMDVGRGRLVHDLAATRERGGTESFDRVFAIVLKPDGAVAWTARQSWIRGSGPVEVRRADRTGTSLLASGRRIRPRSLRLSGSRVTWIENGAPHGAPLR